MKRTTIFSLLFLYAIAFIFVSCQNDEDDQVPIPLPDLEGGILLEIKPGQNSYVGENNDRFYSNMLLHKNDSTLYQLKVKPGVEYNLFCVIPGHSSSNFKMVLLTSKRDTISMSSYESGICEIFFKPSMQDDLYLFVYLNSPVNVPIKYNLYFEEFVPANLDFINLKWEATGNWQVTDSNSLVFNGSDARKFRWIRLNSFISDNHDVSFVIKSDTRTNLPSFGIILSGSSELKYWGQYKEQLPKIGTFLNFTDNENYRIIRLLGDAAAYDYEKMNVPNIDLKSGVSIIINHDFHPNKDVFINNIGIYSIGMGSLNKFYLVVEDKNVERIVFENFLFKEY